MPIVPEYSHKPIRPLYLPRHDNEPAAMKQKHLILTLCERRKLRMPDLKRMTKGQAAELISRMLDNTGEQV